MFLLHMHALEQHCSTMRKKYAVRAQANLVTWLINSTSIQFTAPAVYSSASQAYFALALVRG